MKNFRITPQNTGKLPTHKDVKEFFAFMQKEYPGYIDIEKHEVSAHNEGDLGWFIGEFINYKNNIVKPLRTAKRNLEFELSKLISTFMQETNQNVSSVDVTIRPMLGYSSCRMVEVAAKVNLTETPILSIEYSQP